MIGVLAQATAWAVLAFCWVVLRTRRLHLGAAEIVAGQGRVRGLGWRELNLVGHAAVFAQR